MSIQAELQMLKSQGTLTPDRVIHYARNKDTELHRCFDWDDTSAAHKYRLQQANALIRIHVVVHEVPKKDVKVSIQLDQSGKARIMPSIPVVRDPFIQADRVWFQDGFMCIDTPNYPVRIPMAIVETFMRKRIKVGA